MASDKVLDSSVLLAYFQGESKGEKASEIFKEAIRKREALVLSVINWGEVLCTIERRLGKEKRDMVENFMEQINVEVISAGKELTRHAAHLKASEGLPYGDCFAAALALERKAELITADRDFRSVAEKRKISVAWL